MTWEYASTLTDGPANKDTLDALGADGWELVSVLHGAQTMQILYVFKRPRAAAPSTTADQDVAPAQRPESLAPATHADIRF